ncbi:Serine/threonine-protein phosphatase 2A activator 1 [Monascus purpureus]|uniref:Serine/threonine-protein phosphatase 2A activator n=1 Tax=Monascus purpureus TaxID=5098 RepID=A0A507R3Z3_MONPU|nr:Serine/threonine-protein phosphatase 2A activator 1 [Monascus purpureus]BDD56737.1 Serine/threonine-protein phosphatase 2 Activator 1 [Monascus purpureus]
MAVEGLSLRVLPTLDTSAGHTFMEPTKKIHDHEDVSKFLTSKAYTDIMTFLLQLNRSMFPSEQPDGTLQTWPLNSEAVQFSAPVRNLQELLSKLESIIQEVPPDTGPRRFGNVSFRKWYKVVESRASELLDECLSPDVLRQRSSDSSGYTAKEELMAYFLGSWGSPQRLDYGTGHELSFLAFLAGVWKLNGFPKADSGVEERAIVLGIIEPYLELVRSLIRTYTLEPAGSHGVWGLDDHSFIPYIFGSAQLSPAISQYDRVPEEGSLPGAPAPSAVVKANIVERQRKMNMYFSAIGFIYDVKRGPFWEHSPMLYDISGIRAGWAKINKGMIKMYNAEVLSKFPVVQHFPFGSLFSWDHDPNAIPPPSSIHTASGPRTGGNEPAGGTQAPWATASAGMRGVPPMGPSGTVAPWATARAEGTQAPIVSRAPAPSTTLTDTSRLPPGLMAPTSASWAQYRPSNRPAAGSSGADIQTKAP